MDKSWLNAGIWLTAVSGFSMVVAALVPGGSSFAASLVFSEPGPETTAARLATGVGGAVMSGWAVTLGSLLRDCAPESTRSKAESLGPAIVWGVLVWFILDGVVSLALGAPLNLGFNLVYLIALGAPARLIGAPEKGAPAKAT